MSTVDRILAEALMLPEADRAEIAERLLSGLDAGREGKDPGYDEAWAAEVEARARAVDEGTAVLIGEDDLWARVDEKIAEIRASRATASRGAP